jgi:hypothetical protein
MRLLTTVVACFLAFLPTPSVRGSVVISEIMYNPAGPDGVTSPTPIGEWVEICNTGATTVDVSGWRLDDEDATNWSAIPAGSELAPGEAAVLCTNPTEFSQAWGSNIKMFKVLWGNLANTASSTNEVLVLLDSNGIEVDRANYETGTGGWPASTNGVSIYLKDVNTDNDAGANWALSTVGRDGAYQPASSVSPYDAADIGSPGVVANLVPLYPLRGAMVPPSATSLAASAFTSGAENPTVKFYGRSFKTAPAAPFRIVLLPDSQYYSQSYPSTFTAQTQWVVNHRTDMNIVCLIHEGDIVNNATISAQWTNANSALSVLDSMSTLPLGLCVGNHDQNPKEDPNGTVEFNQRFPYTRYQSRAWYGGHYGTNNDNNYILFSAGGMDFISIQLEYNPSPDPAVLDWAVNVMRTYSNRRAIVASHSLLDDNDPGLWTLSGTAIFNALRNEPNLGLMACGHIPGESRRTDFVAGNTIHTLLADYQDRANGGNGWLRILEFAPADNVINVRTYSPSLDQYETDANSEFSLWYTMGGASFTQLAEVAVPAGGTPATFTWERLTPGWIYQWYATASTGQMFIKFPVQEFTTSFDELDLNRDGGVDQDDVTLFMNCFTGAGIPYQLPAFPIACTLTPGTDGTIPVDRDKDDDVDQDDFGSLQRCLGQAVCD